MPSFLLRTATLLLFFSAHVYMVPAAPAGRALSHLCERALKAPADSARLLDQENGFRSYHFGDPIAKFAQLKQLSVEGTTSYYTNPKEQLQFLGVPLTQVLYIFENGKLSAVSLDTQGLRNSAQLRAALLARYGPSEEGPLPLPTDHWQGRKVLLNFSPATPANLTAQLLLLRVPD